MSFTSGKFDTNIFSMANAIKDKAESETDHAWRDNASYVMSTGEHLPVDATAHTAELLNTPVANSIYIAGMEMIASGETVTTGKYSVSGKVITFCADDDLDTIDVVYDYVQAVQEAIVTNKEYAIGEAVNCSGIAA